MSDRPPPVVHVKWPSIVPPLVVHVKCLCSISARQQLTVDIIRVFTCRCGYQYPCSMRLAQGLHPGEVEFDTGEASRENALEVYTFFRNVLRRDENVRVWPPPPFGIVPYPYVGGAAIADVADWPKDLPSESAGPSQCRFAGLSQTRSVLVGLLPGPEARERLSSNGEWRMYGKGNRPTIFNEVSKAMEDNGYPNRSYRACIKRFDEYNNPLDLLKGEDYMGRAKNPLDLRGVMSKAEAQTVRNFVGYVHFIYCKMLDLEPTLEEPMKPTEVEEQPHEGKEEEPPEGEED
ncbi:hypothetical protein CCACVL1_10399 [Corchorus capsularis]|uniref:Uncharacterized protein n=1 Tax=Corchorus capsularis TaxID=210143 RepID=A0A1R3IRA9_COCAP|nr:hypothetical protein CCACVL1_10399 [Corchorus capsularis]